MDDWLGCQNWGVDLKKVPLAMRRQTDVAKVAEVIFDIIAIAAPLSSTRPRASRSDDRREVRSVRLDLLARVQGTRSPS